MEANQITFELRYFMRETQMFACFQSLAIKKNAWNCTTSGKEIELSKTMRRFWSGCHVFTKGEEVGPLGHKKFVSINGTSQGSWKTSALEIEPGMRDHEKRNCAGFNVKEENYWRAILLSPFPSLQFDKSLDELSGFRKNVEQTSLVPISLLWFWSSSSFWHGQGKTMLASIEDKWGSIRRKASQEQPQGCLVVKGWSLFIGARSQGKTNHDRVCLKSGQDGRRRKHGRFSILVEEYPRRNPKWEAGNLRRQDQRRKWQVLEPRQCSMRDDRCFRLLTIQR